jgi:hypothetical protein
VSTVTTTANSAPAPRARTRGEEPEWIVWATVILAVIIGLVLQFATTGQTNSGTGAGMTVSYPSTWVAAREDGAAFAVANTLQGGAFAQRLALFEKPKSDLLPLQGGIEEAAQNWAIERQQALSSYRILSMTKPAGEEGVRVESAYVMDSPFGASAVPTVMRAVDVVRQKGDKFYILSYATKADDFAAGKDTLNNIIASWKLP